MQVSERLCSHLDVGDLLDIQVYKILELLEDCTQQLQHCVCIHGGGSEHTQDDK